MKFFTKDYKQSRSSVLGVSVLLAAFGLLGCSDKDNGIDVGGGTSDDAGIIAVKNWEVAGVSQKGPFVTGSAVSVQELDGITLNQTGKSFKGSIKSDKGDFSISGINLASQYALLDASGYYRDEISGKKSSGTITLRAITDLSNRKTVNINLLTHLEYERVIYLVTKKKMSIAKAKAQAEKEILAAFGINGDFEESEDLNIFESGDGNGALLAISVLMQSDVDVAGLTERLGNFSIALAEGGAWDDVDTKASIADWACDVDLKETLVDIRENVEGWKYADSVPNFEKFVSNFWWDNYGLGTCNAKREGEVKRNINKLSKMYDEYFVCESDRWSIPDEGRPASSSSLTDNLSSSNQGGSSSSLYNPYISSSSVKVYTLPEKVSFLEDIGEVVGHEVYADGKQDVWMVRSRKDSAAATIIEKLGEADFKFETSVKNDSVASEGYKYDSTSHIYVFEEPDLVYKVALTTYIYSSFPSSSGVDVKVVVLRDGVEEVPTVDVSSLRFVTEYPEEISKIGDVIEDAYPTRIAWSDDSLYVAWQVENFYGGENLYPDKNVEDERECDSSLAVLNKMLLDDGYKQTSVESLSAQEAETKYGYHADRVAGDLDIYHFVKETEEYRFEVDTYSGWSSHGGWIVAYNCFVYARVKVFYKNR